MTDIAPPRRTRHCRHRSAVRVPDAAVPDKGLSGRGPALRAVRRRLRRLAAVAADEATRVAVQSLSGGLLMLAVQWWNHR